VKNVDYYKKFSKTVEKDF